MTKKEMINKAFNSIGFVIVIGILILGKSFLFYNNTVAVEEPLGMNTVLGTISFVLAFVCFLLMLPNRARSIIAMILNILISVILLGDHIYYTFSNNVLSVAQITNLQYGEEIMSTLPMVLKWNLLFYFVDIVILLGIWLLPWVHLEKKTKTTQKQKIAKLAIGAIGIVIFCFVSVPYIEKGKQKSYNKDLQIREATIFGYHISDIQNAFTMQQQTKYKEKEGMLKDYNELKLTYEIKYGEESYPIKGSLEGKNVIILQLESVQEFVINQEINGKQITPNLNKFFNENITFTDMHMQSYSTTADSEHSTVTSLYPMENGMSFSRYFTNTYDDIFNVFQKKEYHTSYMHGNYPYFWNRGNVYGRMDLDELVLKEQFEDTSENINGDLSDELFYKQVVEKWKTYKQPFFSYIVSASSHTPFTLEGLQDRSKVTLDVGKYKNTYFGNYLEAMNYADYAFGLLIEALKKEGLYEDTAILVFGDHNGLTMYDKEMVDFLQYTNPKITDIDLKLNYTRVACGFKIPGMKPAKIEKPVSKLDIKPTLAYLCNLEDGFSLGTNAFASKDFVCLNNERIITSRYYYDGQWYDRKTGNILEWDTLDNDTRELLEEYTQNMKTELEISNSISINNLLK